MIFFRRPRKRLNSEQREALYVAEKTLSIANGTGEFPICKLCDQSVLPGHAWDENHNRYLPHAIGGEPDGLSHSRCNRDHGSKVATPQVAKLKRIRRKFLDLHRTLQPLPGGRDDRLKKKMNRDVVLRATGERP